MFILKKNVDWSFLTDGFNIPLEFQPLMHGCYSEYIQPGEKKIIKILIGTECYEAKLNNINFSRSIRIIKIFFKSDIQKDLR